VASTRVVGPDLPSGLRRPDRSVSLPSEPPLPPMVDPRKAAAATGGAIWFYGGYGNPPQKQIGPNMWDGAEGEYQKLSDAVQKTAAEAGEAIADTPEEILDWLGDEPTWVEITPDGTVVRVPEPDPADWVPGEVPEVVPEVVPPAVGGSLLMEGLGAELGGRLAGFPPTDMDTPLAPAEPPGQGIEDMESGVAAYPELPIGFMQGLTADQAFRQHQATSGVEQPRSDRAHPERPTPPTSREPWVPLSDEQNAINAEGIEEARKTLNGSRNPELRAMDSQMMTDLMAERAAQPEQGYFGGMGNAVQELTETVRAMSGEEQGMMIAALIAAGLLTAGSGGMLAPAGAALMGGAGIAALSQ